RRPVAGLLLFLKARTAQHGPVLRRLEGNRCLFAALRARRPRLGPHTRPARAALGLALLATFGIVAKLLIVEENLFARSEDELRAAVYACQNSIGEYHGRSPKPGRS